MLGLGWTGGLLEVQPRQPAAPRARSAIVKTSRRSGTARLRVLRAGEVRVRVAQPGLVGRARARVELLEEGVGAVLGPSLRHLALRVEEVAEADGLGRAGLLAGRPRVPVPQLAAREPGVDRGRVQ